MRRAHERLLRHSHWAIDGHVERHQYLDNLREQFCYSRFRQKSDIRTRGIDATYIELSQVFTASPNRVGIPFRWHHPLLAFRRQAIQDGLPKGPIWNVKL